jgi:glycosyltransferase involved in cell wall biosynthesis
MSTGGAERVAANLVNAWAARGDMVTLLVTYSDRGESYYAVSDQVRLCYLADLVGTRGRGLSTYLKRFLALRAQIRSLQTDIVVSFLTNVNVAALLAGCCSGKPVIVCEHTYPPQLPVGIVWSRLRRWTYPLASRVAMLTSEGLGWLQLEIPRARGVVMPNPVPYPLQVNVPELLPTDVVRTDRKVLLAVGRMSEEKGFSTLIEVFASLAEQCAQWNLVILGDGPLRPVLEQQVQAASLGARVLMPGRAGNVGAWYERADLYVLSSRVEGFPNTLGEAMAHGCAAVSFDCDTGPRDLIRHELDGLLVPPGDLAALALALGRLMQDDTLRAQLAARALEVRSRYSIQRVLGLWDELFDEVKASRRSAT